MDFDNDYDEDGNNIVSCPICLNVYCPSKDGGKCPEEEEFAKYMTEQETIKKIQEAVPEIMDRIDVEKRKDVINNCEILGRDITPIDILKTRTDLAIDGLGGVFERISCDKEGKLWRMIYLGHYEIDKPFHEQSDETKKFIGNLLA